MFYAETAFNCTLRHYIKAANGGCLTMLEVIEVGPYAAVLSETRGLIVKVSESWTFRPTAAGHFQCLFSHHTGKYNYISFVSDYLSIYKRGGGRTA